jgi:hypothetical protein
MRTLVVLAALVAALPASGSASPQRGFAFGRDGGNIRPFTVTISNDGVVRSTGAVTVGTKKLTRLQIAVLNRVAAANGFGAMPPATNCAGTLPDVAATYVRVGPRRVQVHGACVPAYRRVWNALSHAVKLST